MFKKKLKLSGKIPVHNRESFPGLSEHNQSKHKMNKVMF